MKRLAFFVLAFVIVSNANSTAWPAGDQPPVWEPIMDGETLDGWHKNGLGDWTVEQQAFVGQSDKEKLYGHLVSNRAFEDFTVRFQFRCTSGDSGFFIRTKMEQPDKTRGLQIQVGPCGSGTGGIYESYGRGWLQKPTEQQENFVYNHDGWNDVMITAEGSHVVVHVNGFKTADVRDEKIKQEAGVFALQMHSGVVNHTMFRKLAVLKQGRVVPRAFLYDHVRPIEADSPGAVQLPAAAAMNEGPASIYRPARGAIELAKRGDQVFWPVNVKEGGQYDVRIEWSLDGDNAIPFLLQLGGRQLTGRCAPTDRNGGCEEASVGRLTLRAGEAEVPRVVFQLGASTAESPLYLRRIKLVPAT